MVKCAPHIWISLAVVNGYLKVYIIKVDNTSQERKMAEKLIIRLEAAMKEVEEKWVPPLWL